MSAPRGQPASVGTEAEDYGDTYYRRYDGNIDQPYDWDSPHWRTFFTTVAERIRAVANPSSVLDVGCGKGLLVQAFCEQGVDAYGIDVSQHAIETAHPDVACRLSVASAEQVEGSWELITCIEVLEHMASASAERAIDSMCAASDRIILSSTPSHFNEPTHVNVRELAAWAASFAERGLFRRTDVDLSFVAPWTVLFERADLTQRDVVYRYEHYAYPMRVEVLEKRAALRDAHREFKGEPSRSQLDEVRSQLDEAATANLHLRHQLLTSRDHAIGAEAETAQWRLRYEGAAADLHEIHGELGEARRELVETHHELGEARRELVETHHELGEARRELVETHRQLGEARDELVDTHQSLARTLDQLHTAYGSTRWRVGGLMVGPFSRLRRRLR